MVCTIGRNDTETTDAKNDIHLVNNNNCSSRRVQQRVMPQYKENEEEKEKYM